MVVSSVVIRAMRELARTSRPGPARLDQTAAAVEVAYPHCGQPLLRGTTGDRTDPAFPVLTHRRTTVHRMISLSWTTILAT